MPSPTCEIRPAAAADVPVILDFIRQLAVYEKLEHAMVATEELLGETLFGERPAAEVVLAICEGRAAGFALFFPNYSTFLARPGLYLEDLFVVPDLRGRGIGRALFVHLAKLANQRGYGRMEWSVLDWNEPSIEFYKSLGASAMDEWTVYRLTGTALEKFADD